MIRPVLILAAAMAATPALAADSARADAPVAVLSAAEQWKQLTVLDDLIFWIDLDSIVTKGGKRHARLRTTFVDPNNKALGFFDIAADCTTRTVDTLHLEVVLDGKVMASQDHQPGEQTYTLDDAEGKIIAPYLCP